MSERALLPWFTITVSPAPPIVDEHTPRWVVHMPTSPASAPDDAEGSA